MTKVTSQGKALFCERSAGFFSPPDEETVDQILEGKASSLFADSEHGGEGGRDFLKGWLPCGNRAFVLEELKRAYGSLFLQSDGGPLSLSESFYKSWSDDPHASLPFAGDKGLLMGDPALHLLALYRECGLEFPDEFRGCPDHIALELEFLSYLYRWMGDREIKRFIDDHLDWVPLLKEGLEKVDPHPFYRELIERVDHFLNVERERLERA